MTSSLKSREISNKIMHDGTKARNIYITIPLISSSHRQDAPGNLENSHLLHIGNMIKCIYLSTYQNEVKHMDVTVWDIDDPTIDRRVSRGVKDVIGSLIDEIFGKDYSMMIESTTGVFDMKMY